MFVKGPSSLLVFAYQRSELPQDLRHECAHALIHLHFQQLPLWLDEGLAEYFERTNPVDVPCPKKFPDSSLDQATEGDWADLEAISEVGQMTRHDYDQAYRRVRHLVEDSESTLQSLQRYVRPFARPTPR